MSARDELAESITTAAEATSSAATPAPATPDVASAPNLEDADYWRRGEPVAWTPAFEGQREPFRPGNRMQHVSGHRSERAIGERAARLAAELLADMPELDRPRHRHAVRAWAFAEARVELHREHEDRVGLFDQKGAVRSHERDVRAAETQAAARRAELGMTPAAEARLRRDQGAAVVFGGAELLAARVAEGRAALDARAAAELAADVRGERDGMTTDREEDGDA